jgi:hypothetical protein
MNQSTFFKVVTVFVALLGGACTISETPAPPLMGPSELALSLALAARPDILSEDGASQSVITITARDAHGQAVRDLDLRIDVVDANGNIVTDRGTLSATRRITDSSGTTSVVFTAPLSPAPGVDDPLARNPILIQAMPVGTDFGMTFPRIVSIRLVPTQIIFLPGAPIPSFTSPASATVGAVVQVNASASSDSDGFIVSYTWNWGDGTTDTGAIEDHDWSAPGTYIITLTVRDDSGKESSLGRAINITP